MIIEIKIVNQIQGSYTGYTISEQFSIILCDPNCKDDNARFLTIPLKSLSHQVTCAFLA